MSNKAFNEVIVSPHFTIPDILVYRQYEHDPCILGYTLSKTVLQIKCRVALADQVKWDELE